MRGLTKIFKAMDSSGNNKLECEEFRNGLGEFGISITQEDAQMMMNRLDSNHDGSVDFQEFLRALKVSFSFVLYSFSIFKRETSTQQDLM